MNLIAAQDVGSAQLYLTFDAPATVNAAGIPDLGAFTVNALSVNVTAAVQVSPNVIYIQQTIDPSSGLPAGWISQPPWITETINTSSTAVIT